MRVMKEDETGIGGLTWRSGDMVWLRARVARSFAARVLGWAEDSDLKMWRSMARWVDVRMYGLHKVSPTQSVHRSLQLERTIIVSS